MIHTYRTSDNRRMTVKVTRQVIRTTPPPSSETAPDDIKQLFDTLKCIDTDYPQFAVRRESFLRQMREQQGGSDGLWKKES